MKFSVGEIAIYIGNGPCSNEDHEVLAVGPFVPFETVPLSDAAAFRCPDAVDYVVRDLDGINWGVDECHLRKRCPPEEPAEDEFQQQLSQWLNREAVCKQP